MNAKNVLDRILKALNMSEETEVKYAKLEDGTIVEGAGFEVGDELVIVTEDGKLAIADGEHELVVETEEGTEIITVSTQDGVVTEVKVEEEISEEVAPTEEEILAEQSDERTFMEKSIDELTDDNLKTIILDLSYRIEELEKLTNSGSIQEPEEETFSEEEIILPDTVELSSEEEDEDELPRLDGAPVEEVVKFSKKSGVDNSQSKFLSKLYK